MSQTSRQLLDLFDKALSDVRREAASGTLDGSGRFYTGEELEAQRLSIAAGNPASRPKASAA